MMKRQQILSATALAMAALTIGRATLARGAATQKAAAPPEPKPTVTIPVQPLGFEPPSLFYMAARPSELTLNFIDASHLLFTFRVLGLVQRGKTGQPGDEDQLIRAVVLDLATGKVVRQAQWTMHDHDRYLWALADGKFLIRERDTLYLTDSSLQLKPWETSPLPLLLVGVSPNRRLVAVERQEPGDTPSLAPSIDLRGDPLDRPQHVGIVVYRAATKKALFTSESPRPMQLPLIESGFLQVLQQKNSDLWVLRRVQIGSSPDAAGPPQVMRKDVFMLRSKCDPALLPLSSSVALAGCAGDGEDHEMTVLNIDGKQLWDQWWQGRYVWHTVAYAQNGSRFALGSLITDHPFASTATIDAQSILGQIVGVFDTATGRLILVRDAQPIVSAGQNFALSADGRQFAILRQQAIEVYALPPENPVTPTTAATPAKKH